MMFEVVFSLSGFADSGILSTLSLAMAHLNDQ